MNNLFKRIFMLAFLTFGLVGLQACDDGPAENFGEELDDAADDVGDAADDAADDVDDAF